MSDCSLGDSEGRFRQPYPLERGGYRSRGLLVKGSPRKITCRHGTELPFAGLDVDVCVNRRLAQSERRSSCLASKHSARARLQEAWRAVRSLAAVAALAAPTALSSRSTP